MRLVTYDRRDNGGRPAAGVLLGDEVAPDGASVQDLLWAGAPVRYGDERIPLREVRLLPPVRDPEKIICMGLNYHDHAAEAGRDIPEHPLWFGKFINSLAADQDPVVLPA